MRCPTCDHELMAVRGIAIKSGYLITSRGSIKLKSPIMTTIINALIRGPTDLEVLIELVYGNRESSPEKPSVCIQVQLCRLRPRILALGWKITTMIDGGCTYKLERATHG